MTNNKAALAAEHFLNNEKQFHLGILPTEQSNPKTKGLDTVFNNNIESGIKMLLSVDEDIIPMAERVFAGKEFSEMLESAYSAINDGGKIVFSGCGATGRLSILLESMWRTFFRKLEKEHKNIFDKISSFEDSVFSIMTGGDYALIKSVESFEDYPQFGQRQAQDLNLSSDDVLIAITEGGETSSVIGTVNEAVRVGAKAFLLFNNPADVLCQHVERSRKVIENPAVTVLDLYCGPMALAGSTRMQATSSEQLIAGAMLEKLLGRIFSENLSASERAIFPEVDINYAEELKQVINDLQSSRSLKAISEYMDFEKEIYQAEGRITYFVDEYLIDIFTDTTERAPTFMLAPFRKYDDTKTEPSFAFVKTPLFSTADAWTHYLGRELRCLDWSVDDYIKMNVPEEIIRNPPAISKEEMLKFLIGNEEEACRFELPQSAAVLIYSGNEYCDDKYINSSAAIKSFPETKLLVIGDVEPLPEEAIMVPGKTRKTPLMLMDHMKVKLVLNTISTGVMVLLGRVSGNWMSWVEVSNKKLRDRAIRLIAELCEVSYHDACYALHDTLNSPQYREATLRSPISPVQYTMKEIKNARIEK